MRTILVDKLLGLADLRAQVEALRRHLIEANVEELLEVADLVTHGLRGKNGGESKSSGVLKCLFCNRPRNEVKNMFGPLGTNDEPQRLICNRCVETAAEAMSAGAKGKASTPFPVKIRKDGQPAKKPGPPKGYRPKMKQKPGQKTGFKVAKKT